MHPKLLGPNSVDIEIDRIELPPSLERIGTGIRVAGHRISLFQVLDAIFDGTSTERMREMFPTIPPRNLDEVLSFCERNLDLMQRYHAEQQAAFAAAESGKNGTAPTLSELRRRKAEQHGPVTRSDR